MSKNADNISVTEPIAVDLLWLRPQKVGGTESFIRNLLNGFMSLDAEYEFVLLVSEDNADTFAHYEKDPRFRLLKAPIASANISKRIIWQNLFQNRFLRKNDIRKCFEPVYCKPWFNGKVKYTCVIHDLQAKHYPEYHPLHEVLYSKLCWKMDTLNADKIIAISNFVKEDIVSTYKRNDIKVIYNPILISGDDIYDMKYLNDRYGLEEMKYFYTVSQMIPHKNLKTIIKMMKYLNESSDEILNNYKDLKLVITGISGNASGEVTKLIEGSGLKDRVILTGFIDNTERNTLYRYAHTFLFPSVFEGFGMPPLEAMLFGTRVVTTDLTSIPEVTQNCAMYVSDPYDEKEWLDKAIFDSKENGSIDFSRYDPALISRQYLNEILG